MAVWKSIPGETPIDDISGLVRHLRDQPFQGKLPCRTDNLCGRSFTVVPGFAGLIVVAVAQMHQPRRIQNLAQIGCGWRQVYPFSCVMVFRSILRGIACFETAEILGQEYLEDVTRNTPVIRGYDGPFSDKVVPTNRAAIVMQPYEFEGEVAQCLAAQ
jgi:hypothetical protein